MTSLLFVYGSLRRGHSNHAELAGAVFVGERATISAYDLTTTGGFPALIPGTRAVPGELYAVDADVLGRLDDFEGSDYRRAAVRLSDGGLAEAYVLATAAL